MEKVDFKKEYSTLYKPAAGKIVIVQVPVFNFLMIDGQGDPNITQTYREAIEALYAVAYTLKFQCKKQGPDYTVMPLEGLWYGESEEIFLQTHKDRWQWTMMIMQPAIIDEAMVEEAKMAATKKKTLPALPLMRFQAYDEGTAAQLLYVGPYSQEHQTIMRLHHFIGEQGYNLRGCHHEIYLNDPRKTAPEKLKTILRQPVAKQT